MITIDQLARTESGQNISCAKSVWHRNDESPYQRPIGIVNRTQECDRVVDVLEHLAEKRIVPISLRDARDDLGRRDVSVNHVGDVEAIPQQIYALAIDIDAESRGRHGGKLAMRPSSVPDLFLEVREVIDASDVKHGLTPDEFTEKFDTLPRPPGLPDGHRQQLGEIGVFNVSPNVYVELDDRLPRYP